MKEVKLHEQGDSLEFKQRVLNMFTGKVPAVSMTMQRQSWVGRRIE